MCVRVYVCMCVHVYVCACVCVHLCTCMYACVCARVYVCMCMCVHVYVCTCVHVCMHVCVHVCMCACVCVHTCAHTHVCSGCEFKLLLALTWFSKFLYLCHLFLLKNHLLSPKLLIIFHISRHQFCSSILAKMEIDYLGKEFQTLQFYVHISLHQGYTNGAMQVSVGEREGNRSPRHTEGEEGEGNRSPRHNTCGGEGRAEAH